MKISEKEVLRLKSYCGLGFSENWRIEEFGERRVDWRVKVDGDFRVNSRVWRGKIFFCELKKRWRRWCYGELVIICYTILLEVIKTDFLFYSQVSNFSINFWWRIEWFLLSGEFGEFSYKTDSEKVSYQKFSYPLFHVFDLFELSLSLFCFFFCLVGSFRFLSQGQFYSRYRLQGRFSL